MRMTLLERNEQVKYKYSQSSLSKLENVHPSMIDFAFELANILDCKIVYGVRTEEEQQELFKDGKSTFDGVTKKSNHQIKKDGYGYALDILPLPDNVNMYDTEDPENKLRWAQFDGICHAIAYKLGIKVRTGFKWKSSAMESLASNESENTLPDGNHVELVL